MTDATPATITMNRGSAPGPGGAHMTRAAMLDELNAALVAAARWLYAKNYGVEASIDVEGVGVLWAKRSAGIPGPGVWGLYVYDATSTRPVLESPVSARVIVANHLTELHTAIQRAHQATHLDVHQAIARARAFVGGCPHCVDGVAPQSMRCWHCGAEGRNPRRTT